MLFLERENAFREVWLVGRVLLEAVCELLFVGLFLELLEEFEAIVHLVLIFREVFLVIHEEKILKYSE